ncbi:MAG TPA: hypothetical protein VE988_30730 [Gemmataceae bacterium]|nr:hypothetical protein [Gemmataceae bacterium]
MYGTLPALTGLSGMLDVAGPTVLLLDNFTDADATLLTDHTMDIGPGWSVGSGVFEIQSGQATWDSGGRFLAADAGNADVDLQCHLGDSSSYGVVVRCTDDDNGWVVYVEAIQFYLFEINGGSFVVRAADTLDSDPGAHTLELQADGASIVATVAGTGHSLLYAFAALNQTVTTHGLYSTTAVGGHWDNFLVTELA